MNIAIINLKNIFKDFIKFILVGFCFIILFRFLITNVNLLGRVFTFKYSSSLYTSLFINANDEKNEVDLFVFTKIFYPFLMATDGELTVEEKVKANENTEDNVKISKNVNMESVTERNIAENYNITYSNVKIRNQSIYNLTDDIFSQDDMSVINNKKILIYHTHTCESYTPSDNYNYQMTGNYRTTDNNYNVVKLRR